MKKAALVVLLAGLFALLPGLTQAKTWEFASWDVYITVNEDSTFDVTETHVYDFQGEFSWVERDIPFDRFRDIKNITVTDGQGNVLGEPDVEITNYSDEAIVKINFEAKDEKKTFNISYTIFGGIGFFEDHDEIYWNAASSNRDVYIRDVYAEVKIPKGATRDQLQQALYIEDEEGEYWQVDDQTFAYQGTDLDPYYNFTVVAGWPKGIVEDPGTLTVHSEPEGAEIFINGAFTGQTTTGVFQNGLEIEEGEQVVGLKEFGYENFEEKVVVEKGSTETINAELEMTSWYKVLRAVITILIVLFFASPIFAFIILFARWRKYGKDPRGQKTIIPQYEPPDNLSPLLVGTIIDEKVDQRDFTAAIVDLAVRGYLTIVGGGEKHVQRGDYSLEKKKDFISDQHLSEYEKDLLRSIFSSKDKVKLSSLSGKLYREYKNLSSAVYQELTERGYFDKRPDKVRQHYVTWGSILVISGLCSAAFWGIGIPFALIGFLLLSFSRAMPRRTKQGVIATEWAKGFKMYLYKAERYRVQKLTPAMFSQFLPYAMVFEVEKEWAEKFEDIIKEPPDWYRGYPGSFSAAAFSSQLGSSFGRSASAATHAPSYSSASSSSGFGGGGFAGGGGGGGGSSAG